MLEADPRVFACTNHIPKRLGLIKLQISTLLVCANIPYQYRLVLAGTGHSSISSICNSKYMWR